MTPLTDTQASPAEPLRTAAQDVLTDKRDYPAAVTADPVTANARLRSRLAAFAAEWDAPEMRLYDDYDAALAVLKEARGETR